MSIVDDFRALIGSVNDYWSQKYGDENQVMFRCIADLRECNKASIYGLVTDFKKPRKSKGTDWSCCITVIDPSLPMTVKGLTVNIFRPSMEELPLTLIVGDVVKLTFKVQVFGDRLQGLSILQPDYSKCLLIKSAVSGNEENNVYVFLKRWWNNTVLTNPEVMQCLREAKSVSPKKIRPSLTLAEMKPFVFFDLVAQVVAIDIQNNDASSQRTVILVTDYTQNKSLPKMAYEEHVPSQFPQEILDSRILAVTLWDEHVQHALKLKPLDYVILQNLKPKTNRDGSLEASLSGDSRFAAVSNSPTSGSRLKVHRINKNDSRVTDMKQRVTDLDARLTHTAHAHLPFTKLADISDSKVTTAKYRCRVTAADIMPRQLERIAKLVCLKCNQIITGQSCDQCGIEARYQYLFSLYLQDDTGYLPVIVSGNDAEYFFGGLKATCLEKGSRNVEHVKSILGRLWEWKSPFQAIANGGIPIEAAKPFDCMIESYLANIDGCQVRRFKIFNTKIRY